ncbi:MAG: 5'-methylthioadenosine/S-adenosylhomocysteine nucleosidase [Anaerolineales bacterium]|nr:5'-methylthioadenosine/S-adenosylhomocysteine nucleosidase [Anaerolineales bacterium]HQU35626.1 5'-methylthioadenosine/S-adenosylhomocysteine nucleosidase [Anaerolineales bacterium]
MKIVVIISAIAEWVGVKPLFPDSKIESFPYGECFTATISNREIPFFHSGWGKIASAGTLQYLIDRYAPDLIVNLGTCGGFEGVVNQGDVILVGQTIVYDIVELMGDLDIANYYASSLDLSWLADPLPHPARRALVASADSDLPPEMIPALKAKGAVAADWESAALAWVARKNGARLLILRAVSDIVNENEGEAYDNIEIFNERAKRVMQKLIAQLPDWLNAVKL